LPFFALALPRVQGQDAPMQEALVRGILIGGAVGVIGTWFLDIDPIRAVGWGLIAGFLAGATAWRVRRRKGGNDRSGD
jgi:F0F1-type ATP synthase assembly protein I